MVEISQCRTSCSKITTSLVNVSLKTLKVNITKTLISFVDKNERFFLHCKRFSQAHIFPTKDNTDVFANIVGVYSAS